MKVGWFGSQQSEGYSPLPLAIREGGDELKLWGRHPASVEVAVITALALLCSCCGPASWLTQLCLV